MQIKAETKVGLFILIALGIFFYMSFHLDVFRFDRARYRQFSVYFDDVSGLSRKADVKIAGVKIGWVEAIELVDDHEYQAKAQIMVHKDHPLHEDAHALVRQEGLLGSKYLEVIPGDSLLPTLKPHSSLIQPGRTPASVDDILFKVQKIAHNMEGITDSLKDALGGDEGRHHVATTVENISRAAERFASFAEVLDKTLSHNEDAINSTIQDLRDLIPSLKHSVERITDVVDRDFDRLAGSLEGAASEAQSGFKSINSVAIKLDEGKGLLGKLINEEDTYNDLKFAIRSAKNYFSRIDALTIVIDSHGEYMFRPAEHLPVEDAKGYFGARIHPNDEYFYLFQLVSSIRGNLTRTITRKDWFDEGDNPLLPSELLAQRVAIPELIGKIHTVVRREDSMKVSFQFGKIFKNLALRFGMLEGYAGFAIDFEMPIECDSLRWVTTLEAFDFRGRDRIDDSRPHLKWLNRVFWSRNIYMVFGADDFVSRKNANAYFGSGVRFTDEDLKYLGAWLGLSSLIAGS